ncbi:MAG TPA: hypothetical protein VI172_17005 [Candidatus Dormibacteraeota bacterium]|jgi:hypothetical protein
MDLDARLNLGECTVLRRWESTAGPQACIELGTTTAAGGWYATRTIGRRPATQLHGDERTVCDMVDTWLRRRAPAWQEVKPGESAQG